VRLILLDNGLRGEVSHHDHVARHARRQALARGWEVVIAASREVTPEFQAETGALPLFRQWFYEDLARDPREVFARAARTAEDLAAARLPAQDGDLVFLPTAAPTELMAVLRWMRSTGADLRLAGVVHRFDRPNGPELLREDLWRTVGKMLPELGERARLIATNPGLAERLAPLVGRPLSLAPSLTWHADLPPLPPRSGDLRLGIFGELRRDKGSGAVPGLIRHLLQALPDSRFVVQFHPHAVDAEGFEALYSPLEAEPRVELVRRPLSDEAMTELVRGVDMVLLPYEREAYRQNVSGVFALAAGQGVPCIAPDGTWMAEQIRNGHAPGAVYAGDSYAAFTQAVQAAAVRRDTLWQDAPAAAQRWRARYSGEKVMDGLLSWAEAAA
jgi:glycosyltransferase involved in cell wall biosynthesis